LIANSRKVLGAQGRLAALCATKCYINDSGCKKVRGCPKRCIHFSIAIISLQINPVYSFLGES